MSVYTRLRSLMIAALVLAPAVMPTAAEGQSLLIGLKGGVNVSDFNIQEPGFEQATESITGIVGGVFLEVGLGGLFAIRPEVLFSQRGFSDESGIVPAELNVDYIEVPLLLVARLPSPIITPILFAGPFVSFENSCQLSGGGLTETIDCIDDEVETESLEGGVTFGGGFELGAGPVTLLFDGRYNVGLTNVDATGETEAKSRTWSFMGGIGFGIG